MYDLELRTKEVIISSNKEDAKKEIRKVLYKLTDSDYNGDNGEEYYINGKSRLDNRMEDLDRISGSYLTEKEIVDFIKKVILESYEDDDYYQKVDTMIFSEIKDSSHLRVTIVVALMEYY